MSLSMFQASIPTFIQKLNALSAILTKAEAYAESKKIDTTVLAGARLAPDMFPLTKQVMIATDMVKGCAARLSGTEAPKYEDNETTLAQLKDRIAKTITFLSTITAASVDGTEEKQIDLKIGGREFSFKGQAYLLTFVIPNFYFHVTTAYAILRHNGVNIGKDDFLGGNQ